MIGEEEEDGESPMPDSKFGNKSKDDSMKKSGSLKKSLDGKNLDVVKEISRN